MLFCCGEGSCGSRETRLWRSSQSRGEATYQLRVYGLDLTSDSFFLPSSGQINTAATGYTGHSMSGTNQEKTNGPGCTNYSVQMLEIQASRIDEPLKGIHPTSS